MGRPGACPRRRPPVSGGCRRAWAVATVALAVSAAGPARAAAPLSGPSLPHSFLLTPTDQLGFPGELAGTEVTPEGGLFTGWADTEFVLGGQAGFVPASHTLAGGRYPIVQAFRVSSGVLYSLTTFQYPVAGAPVTFARVTARNLNKHPATARITASLRYDGGEPAPKGQRCCVLIYRFPRPRTPARDGLYNQPGVGFNPAFAYAFAGDSLTRDGATVLVYPPGGTRSIGGGNPATPRTPFGRASYALRLGRGRSASLDFKMPVAPLDPANPALAQVQAARLGGYRSIARRYWAGTLGQAMRVSLPERKVTDAFYAALGQDALARYQLDNGSWVQAVNKLRYHAFYIRDAAVITDAYDLVGLHQLARDNLEYFLSWQQDDGLFISRPQQYDNFGEALWAFGEHYRRTGDVAFAQHVYPAVQRAMAWFEAQRAADPLSLLPPVTTPYDNDLVSGHLTGDNFWGAAGVAGAVDLANAVGDTATAQRWRTDLGDFSAKLRAAISRVAPANHDTIPASLDVKGGQTWGNLWGTYPGGVYPANAKIERATIDRTVKHNFSEGIATYSNHRVLHDYLGFRVFQTELQGNRQRDVVEGLYSELAHTTGTHSGFEAGTSPFGDRIVDDSTVPHGWYAAEYVALLRNMLVREQGNDVLIASALSPSWLRPGKRVSVTGAPTTRGGVSFSLRSQAGGAVLFWSSGLKPGSRLRWPVPYGVTAFKARGLSRDKRFVDLRGSRGNLKVSWKLTSEAPTYEAAFARLMKAYLNSPSGAASAARSALHRAQAGQDLNESVPVG